MTKYEAIGVLKTELQCLKRNTDTNCNRECETCDLVLPVEDIEAAYKKAIEILYTYKGC